MTEKKKVAFCILVGTATNNRKAAGISRFFEKCPFCVFSTSKDNTIFTVLAVPFDHKWWVQSISDHPKDTVGLEKAEVFYPENIEVASPWSIGEVKPELDKPPCGAECLTCRVYKKACPGCPATKHYVK
jgi:hypothetical protein